MKILLRSSVRTSLLVKPSASVVAWLLVATALTGCSTVSNTWKSWRADSAVTPASSKVGAASAQTIRLNVSPSTEDWTGLYSISDAGVASFKECRTGQDVPVQLGGDSAFLENAYMVSRPQPSTSMLAQIKGRMLEQASSDPYLASKGEKVLALRVDQFVNLSSAGQCPNALKADATSASSQPQKAGAKPSQAEIQSPSDSQAAASTKKKGWKHWFKWPF